MAALFATDTRASLARLRVWHPEWWVYAAAALATAWLAWPGLLHTVSGAAGAHDHSAGAHHHPGTAIVADGGSPWSVLGTWTEGWQRWVLMVLAMMLPVAGAQVHTVAVRSLWSRRQRSAAAYVAGFLAVWFAVGGVLVAVQVGLGLRPSSALVAAALLGASIWHVTPARRRALRRCGAVRLGPATGGAADLDCSRAGLRSGCRCVLTCGPMMLAMLVGHSLLLMGSLLAVMLVERSRGPDPLRRAGHPLQAAALLGLALAAALWAAVQ